MLLLCRWSVGRDGELTVVGTLSLIIERHFLLESRCRRLAARSEEPPGKEEQKNV